MDLQSILKKTKVYYISASDSNGNIIDFVEEGDFNLKKEITQGANFFFKSGNDFFKKVLNEKEELDEITFSSDDTTILLLKNATGDLLFSFYTKNEINLNIIKILIEKYDRSN